MYLTDEQAAEVWQRGHEAHTNHVFDPADTDARDLADTLYLAFVMFTK